MGPKTSLARIGAEVVMGYPHSLHYPYHDVPDISRASWLVDPYSGRCCTFCDMFEAVPDTVDLLEELAYYDPHQYARILRLHDNIHDQYMKGYDRNGFESYYLSQEMETLSQLLQVAQRRMPYGGRRLRDVASQIQYMGRDVMLSPRRHQFHKLARPRYPDGSYYRGERYGRGRLGWRY